jgi:hypothetical protein
MPERKENRAPKLRPSAGSGGNSLPTTSADGSKRSVCYFDDLRCSVPTRLLLRPLPLPRRQSNDYVAFLLSFTSERQQDGRTRSARHRLRRRRLLRVWAASWRELKDPGQLRNTGRGDGRHPRATGLGRLTLIKLGCDGLRPETRVNGIFNRLPMCAGEWQQICHP